MKPVVNNSFFCFLEKGLLNEDEKPKVLVQELEPSEGQKTDIAAVKADANAQVEKEITPALPKKAEFKTQDIISNYFFIFHLPKYDKSNVSFAIFDDQVRYERMMVCDKFARY